MNKNQHIWYYATLGIIFLLLSAFYSYIQYWIPSLQVYKDIIRVAYTICTTLIILSALANTISFIFHEIKIYISGKHPVVKKFLPIIRFILLTILWVFGWFIILKELGVNINGILTWAGIWGAIFAIASKDVVANLLWSLSLIFSKAFWIGDTIRVQWLEWIVDEVTLNYTKVIWMDGKLIFIPNRSLLSEKIENLTRRKFIRYEWKIPFTRVSSALVIEKRLAIIREELEKSGYEDISLNITEITMNDIVYTIGGNTKEGSQEFFESFHRFIVKHIPQKSA